MLGNKEFTAIIIIWGNYVLGILLEYEVYYH